eukprot:SAG11_NODE_12781_length_685_cov_1.479522_1_plen_147_part_00
MALELRTFAHDVRHGTGGGELRHANWRAECNGVVAAAWQAPPWPENGDLNLASRRYEVAFARRYRLPRPILARAPVHCTGCGSNHGVPGADTIGDHDEGTYSKLQGKRQYVPEFVHDIVVVTLMALLRQCGFRDVVGDVGARRARL